MSALVLEGGSLRPMFSCGVMDALLDNNIDFPYVIGVSAGITDGVSYVSKQKMRNYHITVDYRNDKRYLSLGNYLREGSIFGLKFLYEDIPQTILPFDWETYHANPAVVKVCVTNARTGKAEYLDGKLLDDKSTMLKATCAQPMLFPEIVMNGEAYYDGGIADSIPAEKALADGHEKMLIVLTRPKGYVKTQSGKMVAAAKVIGRKYPALKEPLLNRYKKYNEQVKFCEELEKSGKAIILRPTQDVQIGSLEKDVDKIKAIYEYGYKLASERMDAIAKLL